MADNQDQVRVGVVQGEVFIQVMGRGTHLTSHALKAFATQVIQCGIPRFRVDLSSCSHMDSTFLGVLVGVSLKVRALPGGGVCLSGASERNREIVDTLGMTPFFTFADKSPEESIPANLTTLPKQAAAGRAWAQMVFEAHQTLVAADARNGPRFKDVLDSLGKELAAGETEHTSA